MNEKPTRLTFEELLEGKVQISLINMPVEPQPLTALERAKQRWGKDRKEEPGQ